MRKFFAAFDSFIFNFVNILGRSSRADYWCVMPVLWIAMIGLFWWDLRGFVFSLDAGEMPSLNPLAYGSVLFILVTATPRLTLAMRRLQDSGRKGKWAFLPFSAGFFALMGLFGVATSGITAAFMGMGNGAGGLGVDASFSQDMSFYHLAGRSAAEAVVLGLYEVLSNIEHLRLTGALPSFGEMAANFTANTANDPAMALPMILMICFFFFYPPVAVMAYILFMTMPSDEGENAYGLPSTTGRTPVRAAKGEHNAFASYAILTRQDQAPTETEIAARKETVHSLYEQRVLGRQ